LRKGLSTLKVPKVPTPLNAIAIEHECDPIIDVQCNGSMLCGVLVDGGARVNVMTIIAIRYLGLKFFRSTLVTLKMVNKLIVGPERVINCVVITIMRVFTIMDFHVVLEEDGIYLMIIGKPWLTKSHAENYWGKRYMTIGVHPNC
jgi:phosphatidylglycerophosphate synthase